MTSSSSSSSHDNNGSHDDSYKPVPLPLDESFLNQLELLLNTNDARLISILNQRGNHITYTPDDVYHFARDGDVVNLRSALSVKSNTTDWAWVEHDDRPYYDSYEVVALHIAAINGHRDCVKALLDVGADINILCKCNEDDWATSLYLAAKNGHISVVALLIEKGADIDIECWDDLENIEDYFKAIDIAACYNYVDIVKLLNNHGANATKALYFAAAGNSLDCINVLLDIGCDVNPGYNHSPLFGACYDSHTDCAWLLRQRGADVNYIQAGESLLQMNARLGNL